jgi:hypothetical protein
MGQGSLLISLVVESFSRKRFCSTRALAKSCRGRGQQPWRSFLNEHLIAEALHGGFVRFSPSPGAYKAVVHDDASPHHVGTDPRQAGRVHTGNSSNGLQVAGVRVVIEERVSLGKT